jgi:hypothetical protein
MYTELLYKIKWKWQIEQMAIILTALSAFGAVPKTIGYTRV